MPFDIQRISEQFQIEGVFLTAVPVTTGHINDTFVSTFQTGSGLRRYVHQRINTYVFKRPAQVMENIRRVTRHYRQQLLRAGVNPDRRTLQLIPASNGKWYYHTPEDGYWRTYDFVEGARTYDQPQGAGQLFQAARTFGSFQRFLHDLPGRRLHDTIPGFHDTPRRLQFFLKAVERNAAGRLIKVAAEVRFLLDRQTQASRITTLMAQGAIPERITHNDTKLNNILIDDQTGEGLCVIDLDTVMPGSSLYDFGDMVRAGATTAAEDEPDVNRVHLDISLFEPLAAGYLEGTAGALEKSELELLGFSARLITYEQALRFLSDYLNGDVYYRIHHPDHNLERARTQIKLVQEMEAQQAELEAVIRRYL